MTWLTWRQFRAQAIAGAAVLAVLAIVLAVTGPHLAHLYASSGLATCQAHGDCGPLVSAFTAQVKASTIDELLFILASGCCWPRPPSSGSSGARRWSPGRSRPARSGWRGTRASPAPAGWPSSSAWSAWPAWPPPGLLSLMVTWWAGPIDRAAGLPAGRDGTAGFNRFAPLLFDARGIAPIGYARSLSCSASPSGCSSAAPCPPWPSPWRSSPPCRSPCRSGPAAPPPAGARLLGVQPGHPGLADFRRERRSAEGDWCRQPAGRLGPGQPDGDARGP